MAGKFAMKCGDEDEVAVVEKYDRLFQPNTRFRLSHRRPNGFNLAEGEYETVDVSPSVLCVRNSLSGTDHLIPLVKLPNFNIVFQPA